MANKQSRVSYLTKKKKHDTIILVGFGRNLGGKGDMSNTKKDNTNNTKKDIIINTKKDNLDITLSDIPSVITTNSRKSNNSPQDEKKKPHTPRKPQKAEKAKSSNSDTLNVPRKEQKVKPNIEKKYEVVVPVALRVRSGPTTEANVFGTIKGGKIVYSLDERHHWVQINFEKEKGWIDKRYLKEV